jgi:hypothetical protein
MPLSSFICDKIVAKHDIAIFAKSDEKEEWVVANDCYSLGNYRDSVHTANIDLPYASGSSCIMTPQYTDFITLIGQKAVTSTMALVVLAPCEAACNLFTTIVRSA